ncbi:MAG TPA: orotidine-5'-phosphate decarboxylase, partial [Firmicutes bacterium]|nr:orotidine-5'-phosphate decarboxylase [Bacillota bacterium]
IEAIPSHIPVIVDAKRGDIGNTARMYAQAFYRGLGADAVTVNPYMGFDALKPFLEYPDKCAFVLCLTSNAGAKDFQYLPSKGKPVYEHIAQKVVGWSKNGCCGLVVGATYPEQLRRIRQISPKLPLLIPGIGVQGGDLEAASRWGTDRQGRLSIINSSRAIIYASDGTDFAQKARVAAERLKERINLCRK